MRQEYVVETTSDGRLQLRLVLVPDEEDMRAPVDEPSSHVIIISPDDDDTGAIIIENM